MDRRNFFRTIVGGVATAAAVRTWPFRVFSFPTEIKIEKSPNLRFVRMYDSAQSRLVSRWDVLYGFGQLEVGTESMKVTHIQIPKSPENPVLTVVRGKTVADVMGELRSNPDAEASAYSELVRRQNEKGYRGLLP